MMSTDEMRATRRAWAGVEIVVGDTRLLIDPLQHAEPLAGRLGIPREPLPAIDLDEHTHVLISHLHPDHYDRELLRALPTPGTVGAFRTARDVLDADGVRVVTQDIGERRTIGELTVTPVPAADAFGDDQVSWVVEGGGRRILHGGDTMWHGHWWRIAADHGPFDMVFLPINGVEVHVGGLDARVPATLTPEYAVEAAWALGARTVCAIHHGLFDDPPRYAEQPDVADRFRRAAAARGLTAVVAGTGDDVPFADDPAQAGTTTASPVCTTPGSITRA